MAEEPDYLSLSKRFESLAARANDPLLASSYRKLARTYRALDFWHEKFKQRYEPIAHGELPPGVETPDRDPR
jgi:hypothetical protein